VKQHNPHEIFFVYDAHTHFAGLLLAIF